MSRYGIDYYDLALYGAPSDYYYSAVNFTATPHAIGFIKLEWVNPYGNWSKIKITRNPFGFPIDPWDGTELDIKNDGNLYAFKENAPSIFNDVTGVAQNSFYYYSIFVFKNEDKVWARAGNALALSPGDYKYTDLLYSYLPSVYKINSLGDPFTDTDNQDLYDFLSLFGFQLNTIHTYTNLLVNRYDIEKVCGTLLPIIMQELGLSHEPEIGYQQERILVQNAVRIFKERGSAEGLKEYIKAYSGYGITNSSAAPNPPVEGLFMGKNLMLDYNDSSFEESKGHWKSADASATIYCLKNKDITKVKLLSNVATLTIGAHDYQVGNKVYISGCALTLFNSTVSPVTITSRTSTTISYSLTGTDVTEINAYNNTTNAYPIVYPYPDAWDEPTTLPDYPNKQKGILSVKNSNALAGTVVLSCGSDNAILYGIPVTAGTAYSFSIYSVGTASRTVTPKIEWYDRFGVIISTSSGVAAANGTGQFSVRLKAENKTAPVGAYYAAPALSIAAAAGSASNEWHYFDCGQFEEGATATDFDEARQIHIIVKANRINELVNPHFDGILSADPWVPTGANQAIINSEIEPEATVYTADHLTLNAGIASLESTLTSDIVVGDIIYVKNVAGVVDGQYTVTAWYPDGGTSYSSYVEFNTGGAATAPRAAVNGIFYKAGDSLELTATATTVTVDSWDGATLSQRCNIYYPSTDYTFSVYVKSSDPTDTVTLSITWYDIANAVISTTTGTTSTIVNAPGTGAWDRVYVSGIAPSTAAYATVTATFATQIGNIILLDSALFENRASVFSFFSGTSGSAPTSSLLWEGTPNASRSHYYKNYDVVSGRLATGALDKELLLGTTVALYYAQPQT